jgi:hypothetical protein
VEKEEFATLMRRALVLLLASGLGACASGAEPPARPPEIGYVPPAGPPVGARTAVVGQNASLVWASLLDRLQQSDFQVTAADEAGGFVVAQYSGNPEPYVNCGWIVTHGQGALEQVPAAVESASFQRRGRNGVVDLERDLRLDSRMIVQVRPQGSDSVVTAESTYVLTKIFAADQGSRRDRLRDVVSFKTGGSGSFEKGTVCQSTGRLERVVLDSLPQVSLIRTAELEAPPAPPPAPEPPPAAAPPAPPPVAEAPPPATALAAVAPPPSPGGAAPAAGPENGPVVTAAPATAPRAPREELDLLAVITVLGETLATMPCADVVPEYRGDDRVGLVGYVASPDDRARLYQAVEEVAGAGRVIEAIEVLPAPFCEIQRLAARYPSGIGLEVVNAGIDQPLREGQPLTLDIQVPDGAQWLYLGYIHSDGRVGHIATLPEQDWEGSGGRIYYRTGHEIAAPFGWEMVLAVASPQPLFAEPRPDDEPAQAFLDALRTRLGDLSGGDNGTVAISHLIVETSPADASS